MAKGARDPGLYKLHERLCNDTTGFALTVTAGWGLATQRHSNYFRLWVAEPAIENDTALLTGKIQAKQLNHLIIGHRLFFTEEGAEKIEVYV